MTEDQKYDKLYRTVLKHGKAMIIIEDVDNGRHWDWQRDRYVRERRTHYVKRVITKDGFSKVAYKGHGYTKYSRYRDSCFVYDYSGGRKKPKRKKEKAHWSKSSPKQHMSLRATLRAMRDHDRGMNYNIVEIRTGKGYRQVVN